jgi:DNA repair exonuclease SbcCD nuclease subunit
MNSIALFADPHVSNHKGQQKRLQDCLECLDWVFRTARENNAKHVICLGDLFHDRYKILVIAYQKVFEILSSYQELDINLLIGNHDMWFHDKWDVSSVRPFQALSNVSVIDKPCTKIVNGLSIDFVPYASDPVKILAGFKQKSRILCGHLAVDGALLNFVHNTTSDVEIESDSDMVRIGTEFFKGWEHVFLGHYHGSQIIDGRIEYVGSPLELTRNESQQQKHIILLDPSDLSKKYIVNKFSPRHLTLNLDELEKHDLNNTFLQVKVDGCCTHESDVIDLKRNLTERFNILELDFTQAKKTSDYVFTEDAQDAFNMAEGDVLERFVKAQGHEGLELDLCLEIGRGLCAQNENT